MAACLVADSPRQRLLGGIAVVFSLQFALVLFVLVPRCVLWWESICTGGGCAALFPGFVVLAAASLPELCQRWRCTLTAGSVLTTGSELQWFFFVSNSFHILVFQLWVRRASLSLSCLQKIEFPKCPARSG